MIVKIPLLQHQPEEIYQYLQAKYSPIRIKIKKGYAIVTLPSEQAYNEVRQKLSQEKLFGKRLDFTPYTPGEELSFQQRISQPECLNLIDEERIDKQPKFQAENQVDRLIIESHLSLIEKVDDYYQRLINNSRGRVNKLSLEVKEIDPRNRQIKALADYVKKKLSQVQQKFINSIKKVFGFVDSFTTKPIEIQIEPTFKIDDDFKFPEISLDCCDFVCDRSFASSGTLCCTRLCALNRNQFVVCGYEAACKTKGFVKIYDVSESHCKETFDLQDGASGLAIVNSTILVGTGLGNSINTINLEDEKRAPQSSGTLFRKHQKPPSEMFEIKRVSSSASCSQFITLCKDNVIRVYEMHNEEIIPGEMSNTFEEKHSIDIMKNCRSLQILKENVAVYGIDDKIIKLQLESYKTKEINLKGKGFPLRIKRCNDNQMAVAIADTVYIIDNRSETIVQNFVGVGNHLLSIQPITDHCIFYGTANVSFGMLDDRRSQFIRWQDNKFHRGSICDIIKLGDRVVSCDYHGSIFSWKIAE